MSPEVIAALLGVTVGVVVERLVRLLGLLRVEASGWEPTYYGGEEGWSYGMVEAKDATELQYRVAIDLSDQAAGVSFA